MVNIVTIEKPLCVGNVEFDEDEDTGTQYHDVVYNGDVDGHVHLFFCLIVAISISPNKVDPVKP